MLSSSATVTPCSRKEAPTVLSQVLRFIDHEIDAAELSDRLVAEFGTLNSIRSASRARLLSIPGMNSRCIDFLAAQDRLFCYLAEERLPDREIMSDPDAVREYLQRKLAWLQVECFVALFLNSANGIIEYRELRRGTVNQVSVYPREVVQLALDCSAVSIIIAHNHPSGDATPSRSDLLITKRLRDALAIFGIKLFDHFLVTPDEMVSFQELGHL